MSPDFGPDPEGSTPLDDDDVDGLLLDFVTTRGDLDRVEFRNVTSGLDWALRRHRGVDEVLDYDFGVELHRRMFDEVWSWAGTRRLRETNIGVDPIKILDRHRQALDNARYWHLHDVFGQDERAARLHHALVAVHPFRNGNGRWSRLMADLFLIAAGGPEFTWSGQELVANGDVRTRYIAALRSADGDDFGPLLRFARS